MPNHNDTDEIRRCARDISNATDTLSGEVIGQMQRIEADIHPEFAGDAACALQAALQDIQSEMQGISRSLESLSSELIAFAVKSQLP